MKQRSEEWFAARCGRVTASRFGDVLATIRNGEAASRRNYKAQIVCERLTGVPQDTYQNEAMRFGTEWEPFARIAYEAKTENIVQEIAFIKHETWLVGASPDGFVGEFGGLEIKVPNTATHIDALLKGMEPEHIPQVQGNMWLSGRQWWDFVSYDPRMPEAYQLYIQRVQRDEKYIVMLESEVIKFINEVEELIRKLAAWASGKTSAPPQSAQNSPISSPAPDAAGSADQTGGDANAPVLRANMNTAAAQTEHRHDNASPSQEDDSRTQSASAAATGEYITANQAIHLEAKCSERKINISGFKKTIGVTRFSQIKILAYDKALEMLDRISKSRERT